MKRFILIFVLILDATLLCAQANTCSNRLDTSEVISIAKRKDAYWTQNWAYKPNIRFDGGTCEWIVQSARTRHSKKGKCKYTNGCTEISKVTLIIDAKTKKIKSRNTQKELIPNYE